MTPYTAAHLVRKEDRVKRKCEKSNYYRNIRYYRIGVKHAFAELNNTYILKRKSFATVLYPFFLQYGPCEDILMIINYIPAQ